MPHRPPPELGLGKRHPLQRLWNMIFGPSAYVLVRKDGSEANTIIAGSWPRDTLVVIDNGVSFVKTSELSYYGEPTFREDAHTCHYTDSGN